MKLSEDILRKLIEEAMRVKISGSDYSIATNVVNDVVKMYKTQGLNIPVSDKDAQLREYIRNELKNYGIVGRQDIEDLTARSVMKNLKKKEI